MTLRKDKNFVLICDYFGEVRELIPADAPVVAAAGSTFLPMVDSGSHYIFFEFLKRIKEEKYVMGYEINLRLEEDIQTYTVNGYQKDGLIHATFLIQSDVTITILNEIIKINNQQINEMRRRFKEQAMEKMKGEEAIYREVTELNNELLNSKRIIEKQNASLSKYNQLLEDMAMKDSLTGAFNRRFFYQEAPRLGARLKEEGGNMILVSLDLNNFKQVNDLLGHDFGDRVLIGLVELITRIISLEDFLFRLGGDEFIILFVNKTAERVEEIMDRISQEYSRISDISSISYGMVEIMIQQMENFREFQLEYYLKEADSLMYKHKAAWKAGNAATKLILEK